MRVNYRHISNLIDSKWSFGLFFGYRKNFGGFKNPTPIEIYQIGSILSLKKLCFYLNNPILGHIIQSSFLKNLNFITYSYQEYYPVL